MKKHSYVIIALVSFIGPFILSFDQKVYFIQYIVPVALATVSIGALYIIWDVLVTRKGHWAFNDERVGTRRFLHLPLGEWLFFLLIPYACLFIFEVVAAYFGSGTARPELLWLQYALSGLFIVFAIFLRKRGYSFLAMISAAMYFAISALLTPGAIFASGYLISIALIFLAFIIINGLYTSLPTIFYSDKAILGIRAGSIPLEDFVYNLSYIGLTLSVYIPMKSIIGL